MDEISEDILAKCTKQGLKARSLVAATGYMHLCYSSDFFLFISRDISRQNGVFFSHGKLRLICITIALVNRYVYHGVLEGYGVSSEKSLRVSCNYSNDWRKRTVLGHNQERNQESLAANAKCLIHIKKQDPETTN